MGLTAHVWLSQPSTSSFLNLQRPKPAARPPHSSRERVNCRTMACSTPAPQGPGTSPNAALPSYGFLNSRKLGRLSEQLLQQLLELPGTKSMAEWQLRAASLAEWQRALSRGVLPHADNLSWPSEPFLSTFLKALNSMEMAPFCRRYPKLLNSLLQQMVELVHDFEAKMEEADSQQPDAGPENGNPTQPMPDNSPPDYSPNAGEGGSEKGDMPLQSMEERLAQSLEGLEGQERNVTVQLEAVEGSLATDNGDQQEAARKEQVAKQMAQELIDKFEEQWMPAVDNLEKASRAFDDLEGLMDGPEGFDLSQSLWRSTGWTEVEELRRKLEDLRELRELVRNLGRGGGKGPLRRAPEEVLASTKQKGMVRSPLQPEETRGLTRSGDLSRILPFEAHLLAAGWPRNKEDGSRREGSRAARMLHRVRRVERTLMSYERTGWLEDEPSRITGRMEIRPAAEQGPIIVCLDTSGSMTGARETVAKALALECMRGAFRQNRSCYLYAFSGPGQVQELEMNLDSKNMSSLLEFLQGGFVGGTDVDAPLERSLQRLAREEWAQADILMVTDGEIPSPSDDILQALRSAQERLGLQVHGMVVGRRITEPMQQLCTHLHMFKSWNVVGSSRHEQSY